MRVSQEKTSVEAALQRRRNQAAQGIQPQAEHSTTFANACAMSNVSKQFKAKSRLCSASSRPSSSLARRASSSGATRGVAPRAQSAGGFRHSTFINSQGRGGSVFGGRALSASEMLPGHTVRSRTPWSASYFRGPDVGMEMDVLRAQPGRPSYMAETGALDDMEGLQMNAKIAVELGRRTTELNSRLQGLEAFLPSNSFVGLW